MTVVIIVDNVENIINIFFHHILMWFESVTRIETSLLKEWCGSHCRADHDDNAGVPCCQPPVDSRIFHILLKYLRNSVLVSYFKKICCYSLPAPVRTKWDIYFYIFITFYETFCHTRSLLYQHHGSYSGENSDKHFLKNIGGTKNLEFYWEIS